MVAAWLRTASPPRARAGQPTGRPSRGLHPSGKSNRLVQQHRDLLAGPDVIGHACRHRRGSRVGIVESPLPGEAAESRVLRMNRQARHALRCFQSFVRLGFRRSVSRCPTTAAVTKKPTINELQPNQADLIHREYCRTGGLPPFAVTRNGRPRSLRPWRSASSQAASEAGQRGRPTRETACVAVHHRHITWDTAQSPSPSTDGGAFSAFELIETTGRRAQVSRLLRLVRTPCPRPPKRGSDPRHQPARLVPAANQRLTRYAATTPA